MMLHTPPGYLNSLVYRMCDSSPQAAALSMSLSSHHSYEAALEGAILQQTASVDYYLQTAAPKWTPNACLARECVPRQELQALFARDLQASIWQYAPSAHGQVCRAVGHDAVAIISLPHACVCLPLALTVAHIGVWCGSRQGTAGCAGCWVHTCKSSCK